jgi:hypothetical protein
MKKSLASLIVAQAFVSSAQGAVVVNAVETGGNVVFTGTGSLSTLAWTQQGASADFAFINPAKILLIGVTPAVNSFRFRDPVNFVGPTDFGSDQQTFADSGTGGSSGGGFGDIFGLFFDSKQLVVPGGYVQGTALSGTSTYNNLTFAALGMNTGSYTWSWGSGNQADSLTLNVGAVPVPAAVWLFGTALIGLVGFSKRKKAA